LKKKDEKWRKKDKRKRREQKKENVKRKKNEQKKRELCFTETVTTRLIDSLEVRELKVMFTAAFLGVLDRLEQVRVLGVG
jgi:sortase (surface protein transpeptidase)